MYKIPKRNNTPLLIIGVIFVVCLVNVLVFDNSSNSPNNSLNTTYTSSTTSVGTSSNIANTSYTPTTSLEIVQDWKWTTERDYTYIRGSVKNTGTTPITYFEVTAKYLDASKNVLDSDVTNSIKTILPNEQQEFEIMHKYNKYYKYATVKVSEIN